MLKIFHTDMRMWRNGRRACLRGKFERVGVRPSPSAPTKKTDIVQSFFVNITFSRTPMTRAPKNDFILGKKEQTNSKAKLFEGFLQK